jgi:hypothetical protein
MSKIVKLGVTLLLAHTSFVGLLFSHEEALEEGVSYAYPFINDEDADFSSTPFDSKPITPKEESPTARHANIGKARVTVDAKNIDFVSQCRAEWESREKKNDSKKEKKSNSRKDKKDDKEDDDHGPSVKLSIKWGGN